MEAGDQGNVSADVILFDFSISAMGQLWNVRSNTHHSPDLARSIGWLKNIKIVQCEWCGYSEPRRVQNLEGYALCCTIHNCWLHQRAISCENDWIKRQHCGWDGKMYAVKHAAIQHNTHPEMFLGLALIVCPSLSQSLTVHNARSFVGLVG